MTAQLNHRNTIRPSTTAPTSSRATGWRLVPRWVSRTVLAVLATAGAVGVYGLRHSGSTSEPITPLRDKAVTIVQPLIVAEEKAFIDRLNGRLTQPATISDDWCATHMPC